MKDPRGLKVDTTLSFGAQPQTAYVREMTPNELRETLNDWIRWRSIHGRGRSEAAVQFRAYANPQISRLRSRLRGELRRRKPPVEAPVETPTCSTCGGRADDPVSPFLPPLCKDCLDKAVAEQKRVGKTCGICGQVRMLCCC